MGDDQMFEKLSNYATIKPFNITLDNHKNEPSIQSQKQSVIGSSDAVQFQQEIHSKEHINLSRTVNLSCSQSNDIESNQSFQNEKQSTISCLQISKSKQRNHTEQSFVSSQSKDLLAFASEEKIVTKDQIGSL